MAGRVGRLEPAQLANAVTAHLPTRKKITNYVIRERDVVLAEAKR